MPFGKRQIEIGIMLRNAMFVNGVLCNSEAWHAITEKDIEELEVLDRSLIKYIIGAHPKVHNEFLYLETGLMPLKYIILNRRLMYLHNILKRPEDDLIRKIYETQKINPNKGDFVQLVKEDIIYIGMHLEI